MYGKAKGMKKGGSTDKPNKNGKTVKGGKVKRSHRIPKTCSDNSTFSPESAMRISGSPMVLSNVEACGISNSISDFIRREVANAMMTGILNQKAIQAAESTWRGGNEFNDVKDNVNKMISSNFDGSVRKSDTTQVEDTINRIKNRLFIVEESLKKIESRITAVEQSLGPVQRSPQTSNVPFLEPLVASHSMTRLPDISKIRLPPQSYDAISKSSDKDSDYLDKKFGLEHPFLSGQGKADKKIRDYKLIDKYRREDGRVFPLQSQALNDKRRLFDTKMLLYQKSPFTLHLNSRKDHVPNELGFPSSKATPVAERPRPIQPRIRRTEFIRNPEESQSNWLFEQ